MSNTALLKVAKFLLITSVTFLALWFVYQESLSIQEEEFKKVVFIYDGDTFKLENGEKVRLIGIDAPEMNYDTGKPECYAQEAKYALEELLSNKKVLLETDLQYKDRHGRILAYVYLRKKGKDLFVNEYMVKNGYAIEKTYPPNTKYQDILKAAEEYARNNLKGMWDKCK